MFSITVLISEKIVVMKEKFTCVFGFIESVLVTSFMLQL